MVVLNIDPGPEPGPGPDSGNVWPVTWLCDITSASPEATGTAVAAATSILWAASGRQFGSIKSTVRPCRLDCLKVPSAWSLEQGQSIAALCGQSSCSGSCSCTSTSEVWLSPFIQDVTEARINGLVLPSGAYRVDNHHRVVRQDGGVWPLCQDLSKVLGSAGTWSLEILHGIPVPALGRMAVGELACVLLDALDDPDGCRLPASWSQISREGVTITAYDLTLMAEQGLLGLDICDQFIKSVNPAGLAQGASVTSVDDSWPRYA